ncbi:MAG: hypothetical protein IK020_04135 [Clostridiales bacterium]|nr:hypothetical protein [Clostridiales bacterium]
MNDRKMTMLMRVAAGIMGFLILGIMLFSTIYIAVESNHECEGEECPICFIIEQCENTLQQFRTGMTFRMPVILAVVAAILTFVCGIRVSAKETPVSQKVRMNN